MQLEDIILGEVSQVQKDTGHMFFSYVGTNISNTNINNIKSH
jgi:hypothetical protein